MKKLTLFVLAIFTCISIHAQDNPLLSPYETPFNVPPFNRIKTEHFLPAFKEAIKQQEVEIDKIINNAAIPTFSNTIEALENSDILLTEVASVFYNMLSANTSKELQEVAQEIAPLLSQHNDNILLNKKLFERIKYVYDRKAELKLSTEKMTLLEETYKRFIRGGAGLAEDKQKRLREINERLSVLSLKFGNNLLAETNNFKLIIENEEDLAGLPPNVISAASEAAQKNGLDGKWLFTLHNPSIIPFLQYSDKRELREKILKAYMNRGNNNNENDNKNIIVEIVNLRIERANILGYKSHADFQLTETMAKTPENVFKLLDQLWIPSIKTAKKEAEELQNLINRENANFKLQPWDWRYYTEKLRKEKYNIDEESLKPYFELNSVKEGVFKLANLLFGLTFKLRTDIPKYNEEVQTYEVLDEDGSHICIYYLDFHPRPNKRGGAWMSNYREQYVYKGKNVNPIICNVFNFTRPTKDAPALLTLDEVETLFHEFGHALHGMLSKCEYKSISGTNVPRDFVELPSQIMENWALEPEVLAFYAKHYQTGELISQELLKKLDESSKFNQGFITTEYLAACYLDMAYHTLTSELYEDVLTFEKNAMDRIGLIPEILPRYRTTYFNHIFNSGYSAGYYSYIWSQVLDADAYEKFKEEGIFNKNTANSFRKNILEKGGTEDAMTLYIKFRGKEPDIKPLLKRKGLE
ncbi:MAG: M3 family metallopeptidase [Ignavibacteria bacterium]|nr:M3 family metallopeptidase [Ignavibacteria bacterium]